MRTSKRNQCGRSARIKHSIFHVAAKYSTNHRASSVFSWNFPAYELRTLTGKTHAHAGSRQLYRRECRRLQRIKKFFSSPKRLHRLWSQTLPLLVCNRYRVSFPGSKRPGHEVDHPPPFGAEVMNAWSYSSTPPYKFMAYTGILPLRCSIILKI